MMKRNLFLAVIALCMTAVFSQSLPARYNPEEIMRLPPIKINPHSPWQHHRTCSFSKALYKTKISPQNGVLYTDVNFCIRSERGGIVYQHYINSAIENQFELFLTEEALYQIEIPEFMWDGTFFDADEESRTDPMFEGARDTKYVPDGTYFLQIELINNSGSENNSVAADVQQYTIIVDTRPPQFELVVKTVCDDFETQSYSFLAYSSDASFSAERDESTACFWQFFLEESDTPFFTQGDSPEVLKTGKFNTDKKNSLIPVCFNAPSFSFVKAVAYDEVGNRKEVVQRLSAAPSVDKMAASDTLLFQNAVASSIKAAYDGAVLKLGERMECHVTDSSSEKIIREKTAQHEVRIIFFSEAGKVYNKKADIDSDHKTISIEMPEQIVNNGLYRIFVSLDNDKEALALFAASFTLYKNFPAVSFYVKDSSLRLLENKLAVRTEFAFTPLSDRERTLGWKVTVGNEDGNLEEIATGCGFAEGETICAVYDSAEHDFSGAGKNTATISFENGVSECVMFSSGINLQGLEKGGGTRPAVSDIIFPPGREGFLGDKELYVRNARSLDEIVEIYHEFGESISEIQIHAFANPISDVNNLSILLHENKTDLVPLSQRRAEYIAEVLALKGIPHEMLSAIGCGGLEWIVSPKDKSQNYKNRRACFVILWKDGALKTEETDIYETIEF